MAIRSIAYKTLTDADTNYALTTDTTIGRVTVINDDGTGASNGNTARVFVGFSADNLTDKLPLGTGASWTFDNQKPSLLYGRSTSAGQVVCVVIED